MLILKENSLPEISGTVMTLLCDQKQNVLTHDKEKHGPN